MEQSYPVMVSIYVATYNHEAYIVRALDSILMQKTGYSYEVLVGEDCSTDNTRQVLRDYEALHPGKLTVFYRKENMYKLPVNNGADLKQRCRGKYIIALEGDDFWTDDSKLEKQVSFLEAHPEYIGVAHNCTVVGEDSQPNGERYPECKDTEYTFSHFFRHIMPGQLTTLLCRNYMLPGVMDASLVSRNLAPGDQTLYFSLLYYGRIYCIQESMSAYRHVISGGSSYSANVSFSYENERRWCGALLEYARKHGNEKVAVMAEGRYFNAIAAGIHRKQCTVAQGLQEMKVLDHKLRAVCHWLVRTVQIRLAGSGMGSAVK